MIRYVFSEAAEMAMKRRIQPIFVLLLVVVSLQWKCADADSNWDPATEKLCLEDERQQVNSFCDKYVAAAAEKAKGAPPPVINPPTQPAKQKGDKTTKDPDAAKNSSWRARFSNNFLGSTLIAGLCLSAP